MDRRLCSFSFQQRRLWRTCQLLSLRLLIHPFPFGRPSWLKFFRWCLRHCASSPLVLATLTSLPLLFLSDSRSVLDILFFPPVFPFSSCSLAHLAGTVFFLFLEWVPGHLFLPVNDVAGELTRRSALLLPSSVPCSFSLTSHVHSSFFSDWRRIVSSNFFDTQVPTISTEELVLIRRARCVLSHLRCNEYSLLLNSYLSRIGRTENPLCRAFGYSI